MPSASNSILIKRRIDEVFAFIAKGENTKLWRPGVIQISKVAGGYDSVGAEYRQRLTGPFGRNIDGDYRITEFELNKIIAFEVTAGPARPKGRYVFMISGAHTLLTFTLSLKAKGLQRLMAPMIQSAMDKEVANLARLKEVLERQR